ncbi:hypothetical protein ADL15_00645 [Actinoplanes awajinensis subsp. mycoplanecinus]|uniref:Uncharacterized protein n=1 Tax=Actinoplanes awajinensis subsp. mycoplanecinus TaxID=135947 RepID=A0A0X3VC98_9ACTN|nr:hypothetical protein ADL15_00645 [Actinoplanes awajinensis subsp. mycoplanecinus]
MVSQVSVNLRDDLAVSFLRPPSPEQVAHGQLLWTPGLRAGSSLREFREPVNRNANGVQV